MNNKTDFVKDGQYYIVRSNEAGVFAGYIENISDKNNVAEIIMTDVRRIWYWDGAASLSQLSQEGVKKPENCKFPCEIKRMKIFGVIEIIEATDEAKQSISNVPIWKA